MDDDSVYFNQPTRTSNSASSVTWTLVQLAPTPPLDPQPPPQTFVVQVLEPTLGIWKPVRLQAHRVVVRGRVLAFERVTGITRHQGDEQYTYATSAAYAAGFWMHVACTAKEDQ